MENQWELDKENVQHSRAGRSVEQLNISLAQSHSEDHQKYLKNKRQELELAIRSYSGEDPLLPYIDYVTWTEENYPSGGKDSQLYDLLKKCIKAFSQDKRYHQDARYINIFIAFAELEESKAAVTYDFMFHRGIGTMVAYFWYSFALALERRGDLKAAGEKYEHGIRCQAQPLDFLVEKFELFKRRLAHQAGLQSLMLDGNDTQTRPLIGADSVVLDQQQQQQQSAASGGSSGGGRSRTRKALAALRTTAGGQAPVMRVGSAVSRNQGGLLHDQQHQQPSAAAAGNRNPPANFVVPAAAGVADENSVAGSAAGGAADGRQRHGNELRFEAVSEGFKENTMEPRPWNERGGLQESRRRDAAAAAAAADKPTKLQVHEDDIPQPAAGASATAPTPASAYKRGLSECAPKKPRPDQDETSPSKLFGAFDLQQHQQQQHSNDNSREHSRDQAQDQQQSDPQSDASLPLCRRDYRTLRYYRGLAIAVLLLSAASLGLAIAGSALFWLNFSAGFDGVRANRACDGIGSFMFYILTAALGLILSFSQMLVALAVCCRLKPLLPGPDAQVGVAFHSQAVGSAPPTTSVQLPVTSSEGDAAAPLMLDGGPAAHATLC